MKILFQIRPDYLQLTGGDTIQFLKTKHYLEQLGIDVDISTELKPNLVDYQLVHVFNTTLIDSTYGQCLNAIAQDKPLILSPIYWNQDEYFVKGMMYHRSFSERIWLRAKWGLKGLLEFRKKAKQRKVLSSAKLLLPNGEGEMDLIRRDHKVKTPYAVVPNAIEPEFSTGNATWFRDQYHLHDFLLCVARFEPRKNQLGLIRALKGTGIKLVLVGNISSEPYFMECQKAADQSVVFVDHVEHSLLSSVYFAAKAHVLPSWYETPGLSNLEAALCGCNIVSTNRGTGREYFGEHAWYCDPEDLDSIKHSCIAAMEAPHRTTLKDKVLKEFTWHHCALKTLEAYNRVLASDSRESGKRQRKVKG